jgi:hypothetical protein
MDPVHALAAVREFGIRGSGFGAGSSEYFLELRTPNLERME